MLEVGGGGGSCSSHSAMQHHNLHPPHPPAQLLCKSVPVPFFNDWAFTNSSSLIVQSLVFAPSPCLPLFSYSSSFAFLPPHPCLLHSSFSALSSLRTEIAPVIYLGFSSITAHTLGLFLTAVNLCLPARINSSIFECCEILRGCQDNRASPKLMQYSEAMIEASR